MARPAAPENLAFGEALRHRRRELGWSQERLAREAKVHPNFVGRLERGESSATLTTIFRLARALGVGPSELIESAEGRVPSTGT